MDQFRLDSEKFFLKERFTSGSESFQKLCDYELSGRPAAITSGFLTAWCRAVVGAEQVHDVDRVAPSGVVRIQES
jgi:hypothetical protein